MSIDVEKFQRTIEATRDERARVRRLVASRRFSSAEPDRERFASYSEKIATAVAARSGAEALQGPTFDLQPSAFLVDGDIKRRAVAYVEVIGPSVGKTGSGFLISSALFLTNQHVIEDVQEASYASIRFDHEVGRPGALAPTTFRLAPEKFAVFSSENELDFALVALGDKVSGPSDVRDLGFCAISDTPDRHTIGMNANIIQHPNGWPKMIAVRNNILTHRTPRTLLYETDTDHGSSGAPVFNDLWEVIALHHYGQPSNEKVDDQGQPIPSAVNEGIRISAIYTHLLGLLPSLPSQQATYLTEALSYSTQASTASPFRPLSPPRPKPAVAPNPQPEDPRQSATAADAVTTSLKRLEAFTMSNQDRPSARVIVPLEITLRVGEAVAAAPVETRSTLTAASPPALRKASEAVRIDTNYSTRRGYDPSFIPGFTINLPKLNGSLAGEVAPLRATEANAEAGELKYQHFSIKMNKTKRVALYTATNVDGDTYLTIDRNTGLPKEGADGAEGDTWYKDPRISDSFFLDQSFYSDWSHIFDRGHLTRRADPSWGTPQEAERANADTFHFTNCSPQHFRFNQSAKFWQGVERYVLEQGAVDPSTKNRLNVFQGPIYDDQIDHMADDVQIPSSFFKIVAWKGRQGNKSVGLVVDQLNLLSEVRHGAMRDSNAPVDVAHWRVSIAEIEKRTGLDFGSAVRSADTVANAQPPRVGEARIKISSFADIAL